MPNRPIGLYDSGLGGLTVLRALTLALPGESFIYVGDNARVPYGGRSTDEILEFNREIVKFLTDQGVKAIVAACNTSSALAIPHLQTQSPVPLLGLIGAGARQAAAFDRVGVIATEGTVRSGAYGQTIHDMSPATRVMEIACPGLVPLVERGELNGPLAYTVVRDALMPFAAEGVEALVLGCTHYPMLAHLIREILPHVELIDPGHQLAADLADFLRETGLQNTGSVNRRFYTSGSPQQFQQLAENFLSEPVSPIWVTSFAPLPLATTA